MQWLPMGLCAQGLASEYQDDCHSGSHCGRINQAGKYICISRPLQDFSGSSGRAFGNVINSSEDDACKAVGSELELHVA